MLQEQDDSQNMQDEKQETEQTHDSPKKVMEQGQQQSNEQIQPNEQGQEQSKEKNQTNEQGQQQSNEQNQPNEQGQQQSNEQNQLNEQGQEQSNEQVEPKVPSSKNLTEEEILKYLEDRINTIKEHENKYDNKVVLKNLKAIGTLYSNYRSKRIIVGKKMVELELPGMKIMLHNSTFCKVIHSKYMILRDHS